MTSELKINQPNQHKAKFQVPPLKVNDNTIANNNKANMIALNIVNTYVKTNIFSEQKLLELHR